MFFFFNDTATTEIYTLSLHDALPISPRASAWHRQNIVRDEQCFRTEKIHRLLDYRFRTRRKEPVDLLSSETLDRKSTRLNSSHQIISYAVFCLKKKNPLPSGNN